MRELGDAKSKYRDFYEDKLGIEIEATERAKAKLEDANQRLQELEEDCEGLRQDNSVINDQTAQLQSQLREKDQVLEYVDSEL